MPDLHNLSLAWQPVRPVRTLPSRPGLAGASSHPRPAQPRHEIIASAPRGIEPMGTASRPQFIPAQAPKHAGQIERRVGQNRHLHVLGRRGLDRNPKLAPQILQSSLGQDGQDASLRCFCHGRQR